LGTKLQSFNIAFTPHCESTQYLEPVFFLIAILADHNMYSMSPHPNTAFLSKYQVALPSAIAVLAMGRCNSALSEAYEPSDWDVICGRGKGSYNRPGNRRFREIIHQHTDEYQAARTKLDKTVVLNRIMDCVRSQNNGHANFIKKQGKNGDWFHISDDMAREKVGHAIREALVAAEHSGNHEQERAEMEAKHMDLLSLQLSIFDDLVGS